MANQKVALLRNCKTPTGWTRYPVVMTANGRIKPDAVWVGKGAINQQNTTGQRAEVLYPVGHYVLRSCIGSKIVWTRLKVGDRDAGPTEALAEFKLAQKRANAVVVAKDAGVQVVVDPQRILLATAIPAFLKTLEDREVFEAAEIAGRALKEFVQSLSLDVHLRKGKEAKITPKAAKRYADELALADTTNFHNLMKSRGLAPSTIAARHRKLWQFISALRPRLDMDIVGPAPKFEQKLVQIYEDEERDAFFAALETDYDKIVFDFLLQVGLREQEATHAEWVDLVPSRRVIKVESKPRYDHKIKTRMEREVPLSQELMERLQAYRATLPKEYRLILGRRNGTVDKPPTDLLQHLKRIAKKAGLNCGGCKGCLGKDGLCSKWYLHKFRATFMTERIRQGEDVATTMAFAGNSLESAKRYIKAASTRQAQDFTSSIKWHAKPSVPGPTAQ